MKGKLCALTALLYLAVSGCTTPQSQIDGEAARAVVERYINNSDAKALGPLTWKTSEDFQHLSDVDRQKASELLAQGVLGFSVCVPDYSLIIHTSKGPLLDMIKIDRIVFVRDTQIVGDFKIK